MSTPNPLHTNLPLRPHNLAQESVQPKEEEDMESQPREKKDIAAKWDDYFGTNDNNLDKWKQLCRDLGKRSDSFTSKRQCRRALRGVWVNIHDFLAAENKPDDVVFFRSEHMLSQYTFNTNKFFPRSKISQGSPLRDLLAHILYPGSRRKRRGP